MAGFGEGNYSCHDYIVKLRPHSFCIILCIISICII